MKFCTLIVCMVALWAGVLAEEEEEGMFEKFMKAISACKEEAGEGLNMPECFKTFVDGGDTDSAQFKQCKCTGACMSQKLGTLDDNAKWDWDNMAKLNAKVKDFDEDMYNEGEKVGKACKDEVGKATDKCDAAFELFQCATKNSEKVKEKSEMMANAFS